MNAKQRRRPLFLGKLIVAGGEVFLGKLIVAGGEVFLGKLIVAGGEARGAMKGIFMRY